LAQQFGQAYGVSNMRGQVPLAEARTILARAARAGVGLLDTAANYGDAEQVLAQADTSAFRIVTKTISVSHGNRRRLGLSRHRRAYGGGRARRG